MSLILSRYMDQAKGVMDYRLVERIKSFHAGCHQEGGQISSNFPASGFAALTLWVPTELRLSALPHDHPLRRLVYWET
ncbi:hypothetical protein RRG08_066525 [Elysia crispata]|uniref:Uncharacterized protein n=1 Tax=Elysia crispata TaxID=231223 RepID=A0AAE1DIF8_9GAST|nr:hypothetical protein RRG08_066525 [Elysia crispata]